MFEDFIASLYGTRATWAYTLFYDGKHLEFYFTVPKQLEHSVAKSLETRFNKIIIEGVKPPNSIYSSIMRAQVTERLLLSTIPPDQAKGSGIEPGRCHSV